MITMCVEHEYNFKVFFIIKVYLKNADERSRRKSLPAHCADITTEKI